VCGPDGVSGAKTRRSNSFKRWLCRKQPYPARYRGIPLFLQFQQLFPMSNDRSPFSRRRLQCCGEPPTGSRSTITCRWRRFAPIVPRVVTFAAFMAFIALQELGNLLVARGYPFPDRWILDLLYPARAIAVGGLLLAFRRHYSEIDFRDAVRPASLLPAVVIGGAVFAPLDKHGLGLGNRRHRRRLRSLGFSARMGTDDDDRVPDGGGRRRSSGHGRALLAFLRGPVAR
jgi:hypothetical protein